MDRPLGSVSGRAAWGARALGGGLGLDCDERRWALQSRHGRSLSHISVDAYFVSMSFPFLVERKR